MTIRNIGLIAFVILVCLSVLYLVPTFSIDFAGRRYFYEGLPSLFDARSLQLNIDSAGNTDGYKYVVKSASIPDSKQDVHLLVARDLHIFEERLRNYVGNNFEIRTDIGSNDVTLTFLLNKSLEQSTNLLTSTNADFEIRTLKTVTTSESQSEGSSPQYETLNLQRNDFGFAELLERESVGNVSQYEIALPLSLLITPEKIDLIRNQLNKPLQVSVAGSEWQAYFDYNQNYVPTRLILTSIPNRAQATLIKGFLNTEPTNLAYNLEGVYYVEYQWYQSLIPYAVMIIAVICAFLLDYWRYKRISKTRIFFILGLTLICLAAVKFFNQTFSVTTALILSIPLIFIILSTHYIYLFYFIGLISFIKLLTLLKGFDISMVSMVLILVFTIFLYLANYINVVRKHVSSKINPTTV
ncbi:MAG: hypothetical protein KatS3mg083_011 [Candidatus Dojkabacteria bacterium]|nr:MAG: hypothetical protein KatS3mg083_011 [Candidatus Dojkabacteria bacterium]